MERTKKQMGEDNDKESKEIKTLFNLFIRSNK